MPVPLRPVLMAAVTTRLEARARCRTPGTFFEEGGSVDPTSSSAVNSIYDAGRVV
ncbi:MAG: hypothetical protein R2697_02790 [Ilumatobacteraceae bacterium]